jgi:hypothetical protein
VAYNFVTKESTLTGEICHPAIIMAALLQYNFGDYRFKVDLAVEKTRDTMAVTQGTDLQGQGL